MSHTNRIILLIDMDCFFCQVEENLNPDFKGKPLAVVQYNQWRGGGIIAVNYPARDRGVKRHMRGDDARKQCPEIILAKVPEVRGKAELSKYRDAGKRVADVLQTFTTNLERASVDEAYMDITSIVEKRILEGNDTVSVDSLQNTFVVGSTTEDFVENVSTHREYDEDNFKLALGGVIAEEIRAEVFRITGYRCSAGIAHNKILAKLVCGLHKPNKQTILPHEAVPQLYEQTPVKKITSLGGKFGDRVVAELNVQFMSELAKFSKKDLLKKFDEKSASWLYNLARGVDYEPVNTRLVAKSIGCSKNFPGGRGMLCSKEDVEHWLNELAGELSERLNKDLKENNRKARQMVVSFDQELNNKEEVRSTKSHPLNSYEQKKILENAMKVVQKNCLLEDGTYRITFLGVSASNFQDVKNTREITSFFHNMSNTRSTTKTNVDSSVNKNVAYAAMSLGTVNNSLDDDVSDDDSVYSCSTDEDNNPPGDLVYFEEIYPESVLDQSFDFNARNSTNIPSNAIVSTNIPLNTIVSKNIPSNTIVSTNNIPSNTIASTNTPSTTIPVLSYELEPEESRDSITDEVNNQNIEIHENSVRLPAGNSFFSRYFNNTAKKNVNTFESFKEEVMETDEKPPLSCYKSAAEPLPEHEDVKVDQNIQNKSPTVGVANIVSTNEDDSGCPECGKNINPEDLLSHLDYHYALNMVKNEAHLYTKGNSGSASKRASNSPKNVLKKVGRKKKLDDVAGSQKAIDKYFSNKTNTEEPSGTCQECNKSVVLSEWEMHQDFHAAKRLHMEINVVRDKPVATKAVKPKPQGQKDILGFFKSKSS